MVENLKKLILKAFKGKKVDREEGTVLDTIQ